mmetsp:Transcript_36529/g.97301  ORF Transcript_36529/g.97301 Transcript_36529/m.97301 type:complete len:359 (-) Transcript_36529:57-1133(-)
MASECPGGAVDALCAPKIQGVRPLHAAAKENSADEIRQLVEANADLDDRADFGWTALHTAAGYGACQAIGALLEARANVNVPATDRETPLHLAASEGHTAAIRALVAGGADLHAASADGETPLHVAVQHIGSKPLCHVHALLEMRADPSLQDESGHTVQEYPRLYTNRADELAELLKGGKPKRDPDDIWPDTAGELEAGTEPVGVAEVLRELGNVRFREGLLLDAVALYMKAKAFLPSGPAAHAPIEEGDEAGARARACHIAVNSNAAMCKFKLGEHDVCIRLCDGVLAVDPRNVKALYRKALALRALDGVDDAEAALRLAAEWDAGNTQVTKELADIARTRKMHEDKEKQLARKMFG